VPGDPVAALDLGSNSFHLIVGQLRYEELVIVDRHKETVRLAAGLRKDGRLSEAARTRALDCLERMGQRLRDVPGDRVRVVGTNTLRRTKKSKSFLREATAVLGHPIQVVSGIEEARLIYKGVVRDLPPGPSRLVIDVGGGSTEIIVGDESGPRLLESLYMGCVGFTERFFADGRITRKRLGRAVMAAMVELEPVHAGFVEHDWSEVLGASGTMRAVEEAARAIGYEALTPEAVEELLQTCKEIEYIDELADGLEIEPDRAPVFVGGLCIVSGLMESLGLDRIATASGALRDGLLYELVGRIHDRDVRSETITRLQVRYAIDNGQAQRVEATAIWLFDRVKARWSLGSDEAERLLRWACGVHEVGLAIAHAGFQRHGAYVLQHGDLPGFSHDEQSALAALVQSHRRRIPSDLVERLSPPHDRWIEKLVCLLRLAALLNRSRSDSRTGLESVTATDTTLELRFIEGWLDSHPLTAADLDSEFRRSGRALGIELSYT
jgi:exopolyphosphatase/guanosine-5'-triphosphate,3'-diphosphate pyrophosphatase